MCTSNIHSRLLRRRRLNLCKGGTPYADCVEGAVEKGVIIGSGVYEPGKVKNTLAMKQAYEMGKNV